MKSLVKYTLPVILFIFSLYSLSLGYKAFFEELESTIQVLIGFLSLILSILITIIVKNKN
jgi:hypothetical protein